METNVLRKKKFIIDDDDINEDKIKQENDHQLSITNRQNEPSTPISAQNMKASHDISEKSTPIHSLKKAESPKDKVKVSNLSTPVKSKTPSNPRTPSIKQNGSQLRKVVAQKAKASASQSNNKLSGNKRPRPTKSISEKKSEEKVSASEESSESSSSGESDSEGESSDSSEESGESSKSETSEEQKVVSIDQINKEYQLNIRDIKKRNISLEEKKKLIREQIIIRKKRELELKINFYKEKKAKATKGSGSKSKPSKKKSPKPKPKKRESKATEKKPKQKKEKPIGASKTSKSKSSKTEDKEKNLKYFTKKENLVDELACRWWYVLPDWPPKSDYNLSDLHLKLVKSEKFDSAPEVDKKGLRKVKEVESYPGVFQDSEGRVYDLRPLDSCPSISNFMKKDSKELQSLVLQAIENQLGVLTNENEVPRPTSFERQMIKELSQHIQYLKSLQT